MSYLTNAFAVLLVVVAVPIIVDYSLRKEFPVHDHGVILITGCSAGIGRHAALQLADLGFTVFASVRKEKDANDLQKDASQLKQGELIPILLDVNSRDSISKAKDTISAYVHEHNLPFVGLVNNAGLGGRCPFESMNMEKTRQMFDTNFFAVLEITQTFLPLIRQFKGRIVFISSLHGVVALKGSTAYAGTKHAVEAMADALRLEMLDFDVSVSIIQPGYINTNFGETAISNSEGNHISEDQYQLYKEFWETFASKRRANFAAGDSPETTSKAIVHSLTDSCPRTRYPVGPADLGIRAPIIVWFDALVPDRFFDLIRRK